MTTPFALKWEFDGWVVVPLVVSGVLYAEGAARMWYRAGIGRGISIWQVACFALGSLTLVLALVSPMHELSEHLFVIHMAEHELLMAVAAPLLAVSKPLAMLLYGIPKQWRTILVSVSGTSVIRASWNFLMKPLVATILHGAAIWIWHIPALLDATLENETLHRWQHISFFGTALIFWWAIFRRPKRDFGIGAGHVFVTMVHTGFLGALLTLAPRVLYPQQTQDAPLYGLTSLQDQQLAGLFMWVPAGALYLAIGVILAGLWLTSTAGQRDRVLYGR